MRNRQKTERAREGEPTGQNDSGRYGKQHYSCSLPLFSKAALPFHFANTTTVLGQRAGLSKEVCLYAGAD